MKKYLACSICFALLTCNAQTISSERRTLVIQQTNTAAIVVPALVDNPVLIELEKTEEVDSLVRGNPDDENWEISKKNHRLFIRAIKGAKPISLIASTKNNTYIFDVNPLPSSSAAFNSRISRIVVELPKAKPIPAPKPPAPPEKPPAATDPASSPAIAAKRNTEYSLQVVSETVDIRPREVFDDGRFTYLRFPNNLQIPAIYQSVPGTKEEWLVNSHREGDYLVMQAVSPLWTLRLGGSVLGIFNDGYDPEGSAAIGGTTLTTIKREIIK